MSRRSGGREAATADLVQGVHNNPRYRVFTITRGTGCSPDGLELRGGEGDEGDRPEVSGQGGRHHRVDVALHVPEPGQQACKHKR